MNLGKLTKLVDDKINQNPNIVKIEYYKLITQTETSTFEIPYAIDKIATRLENLGYIIYIENEKYFYNDKEYKVETNEVLVAIKNQN